MIKSSQSTNTVNTSPMQSKTNELAYNLDKNQMQSKPVKFNQNQLNIIKKTNQI